MVLQRHGSTLVNIEVSPDPGRSGFHVYRCSENEKPDELDLRMQSSRSWEGSAADVPIECAL